MPPADADVLAAINEMPPTRASNAVETDFDFMMIPHVIELNCTGHQERGPDPGSPDFACTSRLSRLAAPFIARPICVEIATRTARVS
jgi:hypothetical protein